MQPAAGPGRAVPVRRTGAWRRPVSGSPPRRSTRATAGPGRSLVPVSAERARAELADGAQPCAVCRPDRVLNRL
ncbi:DUF6233 domain-containing protein [Streptomyces rubiginosohelvolus]|uniref:DUF6233 domain-containing protein n=1 Tax=Streptomyces rubiginosohelvolus TaxID=67362 RepID=UPI003676A9E5